MKMLSGVLLCVLLLAGCQSTPPPADTRRAITLDELGVTVRDTARSTMMSDRKGAFLVGTLNRGEKDASERWSIDGIEVLRGLDVQVGGNALSGAALDSAVVYPHQTEKFFHDGSSETVLLLDGSADPAGGHVLAVIVQTPRSADIAFGALPPEAFRPRQPEGERRSAMLSWKSPAWCMTLYAGAAGVAGERAVVVRNTTRAAMIILAAPDRERQGPVTSLFEHMEQLRSSRASRMERILNDSYLRTSDENLDKALSWIKLSLDAMLIKSTDTMAVATVPWDGSISGRDNAQSIAGLGLATGDYRTVGSILRTLSRWQESSPAKSTYGRIADRVKNGVASYNGADVGPWFFREMYEYATYSNDTAFVRSMYPLVKRGIEGTLKYHTDGSNLLTHGDAETWMNAVSGGRALAPRGNRAAELQLLWYFQQLIGSFVATFVGDGQNAQQWNELAAKTSSEFQNHFVDTLHNLIYDHLTPEGKGAGEIRPNTILCLEIIGSEFVQQTMIRNTINTIVYRQGVGTLDRQDRRFRPYDGVRGEYSPDEAMFNGPVWTWLTGQVTYTLTRYDRQDFCFQLTQRLVDQALHRDMVGTLPAMFDALPRPGGSEAGAAGSPASLTGMAEFVRSLYQDYLGIRIDATSNQIVLQPKLPKELSDVDFTVYVGATEVQGRLERKREMSRITMMAPSLARPMNFSFLWMLDNGDAWRGTTMLLPSTRLTIVIGPEDVTAYQGEKKTTLAGMRKLKKFSQENSFTGFDFANPGGQ